MGKKNNYDLGSEVNGEILKRFRGNLCVKTIFPSKAQFKDISKRYNQSKIFNTTLLINL